VESEARSLPTKILSRHSSRLAAARASMKEVVSLLLYQGCDDQDGRSPWVTTYQYQISVAVNREIALARSSH